MGDDDPAEVARSQAGCGEGIGHSSDAGLGTGLDEGRLGSVDEESRGHAVHAAEQGVDLADARCDLLHGRQPIQALPLPAACEGRRRATGSGSGWGSATEEADGVDFWDCWSRAVSWAVSDLTRSSSFPNVVKSPFCRAASAFCSWVRRSLRSASSWLVRFAVDGVSWSTAWSWSCRASSRGAVPEPGDRLGGVEQGLQRLDEGAALGDRVLGADDHLVELRERRAAGGAGREDVQRAYVEERVVVERQHDDVAQDDRRTVLAEQADLWADHRVRVDVVVELQRTQDVDGVVERHGDELRDGWSSCSRNPPPATPSCCSPHPRWSSPARRTGRARRTAASRRAASAPRSRASCPAGCR